MRKAYPGPEIEVSYDPDVCIHAGECVRSLPAVFDPQRRPWIDPAAASPGQIRRAIRRCPSGALRHRPLPAGAPQEPTDGADGDA